jgi:hypothetical protein
MRVLALMLGLYAVGVAILFTVSLVGGSLVVIAGALTGLYMSRAAWPEIKRRRAHSSHRGS